MNGFLSVDKPAGMTSHDVVARVRRLAGRGVKVGHAGTLDPLATGVLPLALGAATRLIEHLADANKGYRALVRLGVVTATDDAEGEVLAEAPVPPLDAATLGAHLAPLRGEIMQTPPMYSALHHQGRRLYDLAREGKTVEVAPRPVTIFALELTRLEPPLLELEVTCSKGTYIRAIARDLGAALGCGAHLAALTRTFVGGFSLERSVALAALEADPAGLARHLLPPETAVADWPAATLDAEGVRRVANGMALRLPGLDGERARAHGPDGALLALLRRAGDAWQPEKVFARGE